MIRLRGVSKKHFVILALIFLAFILGYGVGRVPLIWHTGEHFINQTAEWLVSRFAKTQVTTSGLVIDVDLRQYHIASDPQEYDTELDSYFSYVNKTIPVNEAALILVDVWEPLPDNDGGNERSREIISTNIYDVLQAARENNMLIIHAPALGVESDIVRPLANEIVLDSSNWIPDDKELHIILLHHNIKTLFYVGFATDDCVLNRPYGIKRMLGLGYQTILLRDATSSMEFHDTLEGMWVTRTAVREVEKSPGGYSCTAKDFVEGFTK